MEQQCIAPLDGVTIIYAVDVLCVGGVRTILGNLGDAALTAGAAVCIATNFVWDSSSLAHLEVIKVGFGLNGIRKAATAVASVFPWRLFRAVGDARRRGRRVIVHLNSPYPTIALSLMLVKFVFRTSLIYTIHANRTHIPRWGWLMERVIFGVADTVVTELPASVVDLRALRRFTPRREIRIDFGVSDKTVKRQWVAHDCGTFSFISVSRLDKNRMVDRFLRAFALANKVALRRTLKFIIIGSGSEIGALRDLASELGVEANVRFKDSVPEEEIQDELVKADCFVTLAAGGGVGMAGKIAAGVGIPIVALEIAGDSTEFTATDDGALAELMVNASEFDCCEQMRRGQLLREKLFRTQSEMLDSYVREYRRLAGG